MVYGTSTYIDEQGKATAAAEFYDFAPCGCVCLGCFVPEAQKKRTFLFAYDNKAMHNKVRAPLCCLSIDERCLSDMVTVFFYDKPPFTTGNYCCIPLFCCGPPVMYSYNPKCCCCDWTPCYGSQILAAPCNWYGLKMCICCGNPCYTCCAVPLVGSLKNAGELLRTRSLAARHPAPAPLLCPPLGPPPAPSSARARATWPSMTNLDDAPNALLGAHRSRSNLPADAFLGKLKVAVTDYQNKHNIAEGHRVIFESVSDNIADFGGSKKVHPETMNRN